jgi:phenylpyruvate tautomerase PptA (4-oxalocrotonate tautomerase family)
MPSVLIEVRKQYTVKEETAIIDAVHAAMIEAIKIPSHDRTIRLVVHEPHRFACPPDKKEPEKYMHISIDLFPGRSLEAKRNLYKTIVRNLEDLGIPKDHINILLRESARENWGIRGGQAACDVDLGFKIEV